MQAESVLEFEALRELLGRFVRSPLGHAELVRVEPSSDRAWIEFALADTRVRAVRGFGRAPQRIALAGVLAHTELARDLRGKTECSFRKRALQAQHECRPHLVCDGKPAGAPDERGDAGVGILRLAPRRA